MLLFVYGKFKDTNSWIFVVIFNPLHSFAAPEIKTDVESFSPSFFCEAGLHPGNFKIYHTLKNYKKQQ